MVNININLPLTLKTKTSLLTLTTILVSLSISASTANNVYFSPLKKAEEANLEYKFINGGLDKKFSPPSYLVNKATVFDKFFRKEQIIFVNVIDLLNQEKLLWQKGENIDLQRIFDDEIFTHTVSNQKLSAVEVAQAKFDKVRSGFTSQGGNTLNFDELPVSRRSRLAGAAAPQASQKLQANKTQIINPIFLTFPVFPSFLCRSAFYAHEKCCNHIVQFIELNWINENIVSLPPVINEKSKSDLSTNPDTDNTPNLVDTPIFPEIEKDLTIPEVIGFVPDQPEVANSTPSNADAGNPEVADKTEFDGDNKSQVANSTPSDADAGNPEVADKTEFDGDNKSQVSDSASKPESNTGAGSTEIVNSNPTKVPEPGTISLFSFGLIGMVISRYRHPNF